MKKYIVSLRMFSVLAQLSLIFTLLSCNQEDLNYSCNEEIDSWTKDNIEVIKTMSTDEYISLDQNYQKAVYNAFSTSQRKQMWIIKIQKAVQLNWNEDEKTHLTKLLSSLNENSNLFSTDCPEEYKDKFKIWIYQWIKDGEENFKWTPKLIRNLLFVPNFLLNKDGDIEVKEIKISSRIKNRDEGDEEPRNCNCNANTSHGEGIFKDDCPKESYCVKGYWSCKENSWGGCGLLFLDPCDGYCW